MDTEQQIAAAQEAAPEPEISIAEYRKQREEGKAPEPAASEAAPPEGKTAAEPAAAKPEPQGEKGPDQAPKGKKTFEERFDEVYGSWKREQAERERLQQRLQELEAGKQATPQPEVKAAANARPKEEDFATWDEYQDALLDWKVEQRLAKERAAAEKAEVEEAQKSQLEIARENQQEFESAKPQFIKAHPDFDATIKAIDDLPLPPDILQTIVMLGQQGVEVGYQLAKNRKVAESIVAHYDKALETGNPRHIALAHGEFWGFVRSLSPQAPPADQKETVRPVSSAPEPIQPVAGGAGPAETNAEELSIAEYRKQRQNGRIR